MKKFFGFIVLFGLYGCQGEDQVVRNKQNPNSLEGLELVCSSHDDDDSLSCTAGQTIPLPPNFPYTKNCNQCITKVANNIASVKCPNGLIFDFTLLKGDKGDTGSKGDTGEKGTNGSSCSTGPDGWVRCTDGTSYHLLQGPKGDKGDTGDTGTKGDKGDPGTKGDKGDPGAKGGSCHVAQNNLGQVEIKCDDGSSEILMGCGGMGCWSFGARGNVYTLPNTTTALPDLSTKTPEESVIVPQFDIFNRSWSLGYPGLPTRLEWYAIRYEGYIEVQPCQANLCKYRLTSDDGAVFSMNGVTVVNDDGLHPPQQVIGSISALPGWHKFRLDWFQGPKTQIALALEVSEDNGAHWRIVPQDELKFLISQ